MASQIQYQDPTMQLLSQLLGSKTTTSSSSSSDPAATAALQQLLAQMQQGSTPEGMAAMMAQLFQTGAEQVPALTQQYANASGARTTGNSSLQLALGDLNGELAKQAAQLAMTQQMNTANVAGQLANATRTQTQTQKQGVGGNPLLLTGAGMLLNQANKRGWIDKAGDAIFGSGPGLAESTGLAMPEFGTGFLPQMTSDAFSIGQPFAENTSYLDFGGITDAVTDFGSGLMDYGSDMFSSGSSGGSLLDDESFDMFFADGGMPSRGRTDMGARTPATLQGALQVSDAQSIAAMIQQMQQQASPIGPAMSREGKEGSDSQEGPGFNTNYSPDALGYAQSALKANSFANLAGLGIPGMSTVAGLVNAQSPTEAVHSLLSTAIGMVNPVAGLAVKYALSQSPQGPIHPGTPGSYADPETMAMVSIPGRNTGGGGGRNSPDGGYGIGARDPSGFGNMGGGFGDHSGGGYGGDSSDGGDSGDGGDSDGGRGFRNGGVPGGRISGPGTGTSDSIKMPMARVSNGEYIVSADVVNAVGPQFFDMLQAAFHKGGKPA